MVMAAEEKTYLCFSRIYKRQSIFLCGIIFVITETNLKIFLCVYDVVAAGLLIIKFVGMALTDG